MLALSYILQLIQLTHVFALKLFTCRTDRFVTLAAKLQTNFVTLTHRDEACGSRGTDMSQDNTHGFQRFILFAEHG